MSRLGEGVSAEVRKLQLDVSVPRDAWAWAGLTQAVSASLSLPKPIQQPPAPARKHCSEYFVDTFACLL